MAACMFWPDVIALKEFYASPLGLVAQAAISRRIAGFWPEGRGDTLLGVGFTHPYLLPFLKDSPGVFSCMPASQGVLHWPPHARNLALLSDEGELPFADNSMNRVLVVHALENTQALSPMLAEIWRVLSPAGRLLVIAPNRRGIWARSPNSPFAYGQPFTATQLRQLLAEHSFTPLQAAAALFFPPSTQRTLLKTASFFETLGPYFFSGFGGVLLMQAEKQIYAPTRQTAVAEKQAQLWGGRAAGGVEREGIELPCNRVNGIQAT